MSTKEKGYPLPTKVIFKLKQWPATQGAYAFLRGMHCPSEIPSNIIVQTTAMVPSVNARVRTTRDGKSRWYMARMEILTIVKFTNNSGSCARRSFFHLLTTFFPTEDEQAYLSNHHSIIQSVWSCCDRRRMSTESEIKHCFY